MPTLAQIDVEIELRDPPTTPIYPSLAPVAAWMLARGFPLKAVAEHFAVDDHTAAKAVR